MTDAGGASMPTRIRLAQEGQGYFGQLQGTQEPLSLAGQGPKQRASGKALLPCLRELPPLLRQPLTLDNGSKMAGFRELERASDLLAYLCRPIHPGSAAPKGMAMPFATVFSRGQQFLQDHGGGAAERSRVAERSAHSLLQVQPALGEWEADLGVLAGALFPVSFHGLSEL